MEMCYGIWRWESFQRKQYTLRTVVIKLVLIVFVFFEPMESFGEECNLPPWKGFVDILW